MDRSYFNILVSDIIHTIFVNVNNFCDYKSLYLYLLSIGININFEVLLQIGYVEKYKIIKFVLPKHPFNELKNPLKILYEIILLGNDIPVDMYSQYNFYTTSPNLYNLVSSGKSTLQNIYEYAYLDGKKITISSTSYINYFSVMYTIKINTNLILKIYELKDTILLSFDNYVNIFEFMAKSLKIIINRRFVDDSWFDDSLHYKIINLISKGIISM